jgi:twitching motility protein PilT
MAIRSLIRDDKVHQIQGMLEIGQKFGMQTMNSELLRLYKRRLISKTDALGRSNDPETLQKMMNESGATQ